MPRHSDAQIARSILQTHGIALGLLPARKGDSPMKKTGIAVLALLMVATFAVADGHGGPGPGGPGGHGPEGGGYLDVADDGTVIITRAAANSTAAAPVAEV